MYGLPGFESSDEPEELEFERLSESDAIDIADQFFMLDAWTATRLDTERDDTFRLTTSNGERVLKVAHPADSYELISLQLDALRHASKADHRLPLQRIVKTPGGGDTLSLDNGRMAWILEWLPGALLRDTPTGSRELAAIGDGLGRLTKALSKYTNAAANRLSAWDLQTVPRLSKLLGEAPNDAAAAAIARFNERVAPRVSELPTQIIHNDFNPGNVLVDPTGEHFVTGILDFGDVVHSFRVADLAVALSYQIVPMRHNWEDLAPMIAAFERHVPLNTAEHEVLRDLVAARFAQRILVNGWLSRFDGERDNQHDAIVTALTALLSREA
jgi:Ser/Thr protein kinase RdoA (MazF antagonist)